jgi:hypothetical protein
MELSALRMDTYTSSPRTMTTSKSPLSSEICDGDHLNYPSALSGIFTWIVKVENVFFLHYISDWPKKIDRSKGRTRKLSTTERRAGCTDIYNTDNFYFSIEATSFEEFLIRVYFEEMAEWFIQYPPSDPLPDELQRYLRNVYTEKGRQW